MNGPHDMGGLQCFGPVEIEANEPLFHGDWEKRAMSLTVAMGFTGSWNIDMSRHARESLPPDFYLTKSYYQIWIAGLEKLMLERGMVTAGELESGSSELPAKVIGRLVGPEEVEAVLARGAPVSRDPQGEPLFAAGDRVRTLNLNPAGHTRLPRYARDKTGTVELVHGCHVFPDSNARGDGEAPQWLYAVSFDAQALFGAEAEAGNRVIVDCWEPYLDRA